MKKIQLESKSERKGSEGHKSLPEEVLSNIKASPDLGLFKCVQCGMCTSTCPGARHTDYDPREMVKKVLENDRDVIFDDKIWNCFYCYTCQSICPSGNSACEVNQILRQMAIKEGSGVEKIDSFTTYGDSFFEFGMGAIPSAFFDDMVRDVGTGYLDLKINLDDIRSDLGLGSYIMKGESLKEVGDILEGTLFKDRLEEIKKHKKQNK